MECIALTSVEISYHNNGFGARGRLWKDLEGDGSLLLASKACQSMILFARYSATAEVSLECNTVFAYGISESFIHTATILNRDQIRKTQKLKAVPLA